MSIADYQRREVARQLKKKAKLEEEHKVLSREDQLAHLRGDMDASEYEMRHSARRAAIAVYENEAAMRILAKAKARDAEKRLRAKMRLQRLIARFAYRRPEFYDFPVTDGQRAVLIGLMMFAQGGREAECAKEAIAKKVGVSTKTVQTALHHFASHGIISIQERRIKGKAMNLWNIYRVKCERVLAWAEEHFIPIQQEATDPHPQGGLNLFTTEGERTENLEDDDNLGNDCRKKARRDEVFAGPEAINSETFVLVAKAGLDKIGRPAPDNANEADLVRILDEYRAEALPKLKPWAWNTGRINHGERQTRLAFLELMVLERARRELPGDNRPFNERDVIRNPPAYLASTLAKTGDACRPDLTLATMLLPFQIYDLPAELVREARQRRRLRKQIKRNEASDSRVYA